MNLLTVAQAGGVLEIGDEVGKLRIGICLDGGGKLVAVDTVRVHGDGQHFGIKEVEGLERDKVGGIFNNDLVTGVEHTGAYHGEYLL